MIDLTLSSDLIRTDMGRLLPLGGIHTFSRDVLGSTQMSSEAFEVTWSFLQGDSLVSALREYQEKRRAKSDHGSLKPETVSVLQQYAATGIPIFIAIYDAFYRHQYNTLIHPFQEYSIPRFDGQSVLEGILNAIEHGSDFGKRGSVHVKMYGGEFGALFTIENPITSFDLKRPTLQDIIMRYRKAGYEFKDIPVTYGQVFDALCPKDSVGVPPERTGLCTYALSPKAIISREKTENTFRLLILYPTPRLLQTPEYDCIVKEYQYVPENKRTVIERTSIAEGAPQKNRFTVL